MADHYVPVPGGTNNNNYANVELILDIAKRMQVCTQSLLYASSFLYTCYLLTWWFIRYKPCGLDGVTHLRIPSCQNYWLKIASFSLAHQKKPCGHWATKLLQVLWLKLPTYRHFRGRDLVISNSSIYFFLKIYFNQGQISLSLNC